MRCLNILSVIYGDKCLKVRNRYIRTSKENKISFEMEVKLKIVKMTRAKIARTEKQCTREKNHFF